MPAAAPHLILEVNTRVWIRTLGLGDSPSFREIPDSVIDEWMKVGYDAVWLMGVWLSSAKSREIALHHAGLHNEYLNILPDFHDEDVVASPYAIRGYDVNPEWGGTEALQDFRERLLRRGLRLILDFVPNHVARDHPWVSEHPEWFVHGSGEDFHKAPQNWMFAETLAGEVIIAHGKDPYFDGWSDTAQLDYRHPQLQTAQRRTLLDIAKLCDGVRCDMAMLLLSDVFDKTWSGHPCASAERVNPSDFWSTAIREVKSLHPNFQFIAEAYWGREPQLIELGFDQCYDKALLDQLVSGNDLERKLLAVPEATQRHSLRFLENHDEPRIASRLPQRQLRSAATLISGLPGSVLIYDGQTAGKKVRIPVQLIREPEEPADRELLQFYSALFRAMKSAARTSGGWKLLEPRTAWMGNESQKKIIGMSWDLLPGSVESAPPAREHSRWFINWSGTRSQCWVDIQLGNLAGKEVLLTDLLSEKSYLRNGVELMMRGLYLDMEPWEAQIFQCDIRTDVELTLD